MSADTRSHCPSVVRLHGLVERGEQPRFVVRGARAKKIGQIEFERVSLLQADRHIGEFARYLRFGFAPRQKTLAAVKGDRRIEQLLAGVARLGPGRAARKQIDGARLQGGEALLGRQRRDVDFTGIVEHRRRQRAAEVDVEAAPNPVRVLLSESRRRRRDAAEDRAALSNLLQSRRLRVGLRERAGRRRGAGQQQRETNENRADRHVELGFVAGVV